MTNKRKPKGWRNEPIRHGLASRGIETKFKTKGISSYSELRETKLKNSVKSKFKKAKYEFEKGNYEESRDALRDADLFANDMSHDSFLVLTGIIRDLRHKISYVGNRYDEEEIEKSFDEAVNKVESMEK